MKKATAIVVVSTLMGLGGEAALASESKAVLLSRIGAANTGGDVYAVLQVNGGWGSLITNSSCATVDAVAIGDASSNNTALWEVAKLASAERAPVIVTTSDTQCLQVGSRHQLAPIVTEIDVINNLGSNGPGPLKLVPAD